MTVRKLWILSAVILIAVILLPSHRRSRYKADVPQGMDIENQRYADGVYTGTATGYQPGITVEIEVRNGLLDKIRVIEHSEIGRQFYQRPLDLIPDAIIDTQRTDVDVVGGATATSTGIMAAVEKALVKASSD